jgi:hypothetical protein
MPRPAQTRADAVVDGELPALLSRLTVAVHVVADFGTPVKRASAALELCSVPQPLPVTVEPVGTGWGGPAHHDRARPALQHPQLAASADLTGAGRRLR